MSRGRGRRVTPVVYLITDLDPPTRAPRPGPAASPAAGAGTGGRIGTAARVALAVLGLVVTAADAWLTALLGLPPLIGALRRLARLIADGCRARAAGVIDAEIIEDPERTVWR